MKNMKSMKRKSTVWRAVWGIILLVPVATALLPFVFMALKSFEETYFLAMTFNWKFMSLNNYRIVLSTRSFPRYLLNSGIVTVCACFFNCLFCLMAGFSFEKKKFPGKEIIFLLFIVTLMIPGQVTLIPLFVIMKELKLMNTYPAMFLPAINAFGVFLMRQFMVGLPDELLEAAEIDGSGEVNTFTKIVIPLSKPVLVSLTVFTFISNWNDFMWPLVITNTSSMQTLVVGLSTLYGSRDLNYGIVMAGAMLTFVIPFVLYIILQKQFVEGIALSGVKG